MLGRFDVVMESIRSYWGGMLEQGASTFWEEYTPGQPGEEEQYGMYGDKYGKSLCHAWGASPIYLIGRYCMGVRPTSAAYDTFERRLRSWICSAIFPVFSLWGRGRYGWTGSDGVLDVYTDKRAEC